LFSLADGSFRGTHDHIMTHFRPGTVRRNGTVFAIAIQLRFFRGNDLSAKPNFYFFDPPKQKKINLSLRPTASLELAQVVRSSSSPAFSFAATLSVSLSLSLFRVAPLTHGFTG
jgi:hypothetical protein